MTEPADRAPLSRIAWVIAAAITILLLSTAGRYGIFRDEYYYLMCADRPAWGYVDHPPFAMFFLTLWKSVFGSSVIALRIPPALLGGAIALGGAMLAREMRGNAAAQVLAAVTVGLMPGVIALGSFYSMNSFDVAFWIVVAWIVCRLLDPAADRRFWWALGASVGFGLLNKYSMLFLAVGLGVGILLSPLRRELFSRNRLIGSLIMPIIVLPHLLWQIRSDWPTLEFIRNAREWKIVAMSPSEFWGEQMLLAHPAFVVIWLAGLVSLLLAPALHRWRPLGVAFAVVATWLTVSGAKPYYLVAAFPMVMAGGAVAITIFLQRWRRLSRVTSFALPAYSALAGLAIAPLAIPLLSPDDFIGYEQALGLRPKAAEHGEMGALPQHFADRFGWEEMALSVRNTIATLPEEDWPATLVVTDNYGECGAINYWGLPPGVPPAVSGHNNCYLWWPRDFVPEVVILIGGSRERAEERFGRVELGVVHHSKWAMPYETDIAIWICRDLKIDPASAREQARHMI